MATIIHFNPQHRAAAPLAAGETLPQCEIIIFPGVRIEREETSFSVDAPGPKTAGVDHGSRPRKSS